MPHWSVVEAHGHATGTRLFFRAPKPHKPKEHIYFFQCTEGHAVITGETTNLKAFNIGLETSCFLGLSYIAQFETKKHTTTYQKLLKGAWGVARTGKKAIEYQLLGSSWFLPNSCDPKQGTYDLDAYLADPESFRPEAVAASQGACRTLVSPHFSNVVLTPEISESLVSRHNPTPAHLRNQPVKSEVTSDRANQSSASVGANQSKARKELIPADASELNQHTLADSTESEIDINGLESSSEVTGDLGPAHTRTPFRLAPTAEAPKAPSTTVVEIISSESEPEGARTVPASPTPTESIMDPVMIQQMKLLMATAIGEVLTEAGVQTTNTTGGANNTGGASNRAPAPATHTTPKAASSMLTPWADYANYGGKEPLFDNRLGLDKRVAKMAKLISDKHNLQEAITWNTNLLNDGRPPVAPLAHRFQSPAAEMLDPNLADRLNKIMQDCADQCSQTLIHAQANALDDITEKIKDFAKGWAATEEEERAVQHLAESQYVKRGTFVAKGGSLKELNFYLGPNIEKGERAWVENLAIRRIRATGHRNEGFGNQDSRNTNPPQRFGNQDSRSNNPPQRFNNFRGNQARVNFRTTSPDRRRNQPTGRFQQERGDGGYNTDDDSRGRNTSRRGDDQGGGGRRGWSNDRRGRDNRDNRSKNW